MADGRSVLILLPRLMASGRIPVDWSQRTYTHNTFHYVMIMQTVSYMRHISKCFPMFVRFVCRTTVCYSTNPSSTFRRNVAGVQSANMRSPGARSFRGHPVAAHETNCTMWNVCVFARRCPHVPNYISVHFQFAVRGGIDGANKNAPHRKRPVSICTLKQTHTLRQNLQTSRRRR